MKILIILIVLFSCSKPMTDKQQEISNRFPARTSLENCTCNRSFQQVCGEDGITYNNPCLAECVGAKYTEGPCKKVCICTMEFNPVCGTDKQTYSNPCNAKCAEVEFTMGECK